MSELRSDFELFYIDDKGEKKELLLPFTKMSYYSVEKNKISFYGICEDIYQYLRNLLKSYGINFKRIRIIKKV